VPPLSLAAEVFFYGNIHGHDRMLNRLLLKGYSYPR